MTESATDVRYTPSPEARWRLTAGSAEVDLAIGPAGLSLVSLRDREGGLGWRLVEGQPATVFALAGERLGARGWRLRSWDAEEDDRHVVLRVVLEADGEGGRLVLTEAVWLAADLPVLRRWVELRNEGAAPLTIERYHLLNLALDQDPAVTPLEVCTVDAFAGHRLDRWEPGDANFALQTRRLGPGEAVRYGVGAYQQACSWLALAGETAGLAVGL